MSGRQVADALKVEPERLLLVAKSSKDPCPEEEPSPASGSDEPKDAQRLSSDALMAERDRLLLVVKSSTDPCPEEPSPPRCSDEPKARPTPEQRCPEGRERAFTTSSKK
jgi:hypothetical protein